MTLVISDTHLGKYDEKKDKFLKKLISKYERVILNGDFWDNWGEADFSKFVNSEYKELFKLLKEKETVYIYGNHDYKAQYYPELTKVFSDIQAEEFDIEIGGQSFHFEHGHNFFYDNDERKFLNFYFTIDKFPKLRKFIYKSIQLSYKYFSKRVSRNKMATKRNEYIKSVKPQNTYYVIGHTHIPEHDENNRFVNTGCIIQDFVTYATIDNNGGVDLIREKFKEKFPESDDI
jgi:predicted phosphodiesterase